MMGESFGESLRHIRKSRGMTLEEMAKLLGSSKQALSRYERNERTPKITVAARIADTLGVSLEDMHGYEPHNMDPCDFFLQEMQEKYMEELYEIAEVFTQLDSQQQKMFMRFVRSIQDD